MMAAREEQALAEKFAPYFDAAWYLKKYPDVAGAEMDPLVHYVRHGVTERRDPHPVFSTRWYLAQYPDVAAAGMGALRHYIDHGARERRDPHPRFESAHYIALHRRDREAAVNPLLHYLRHYHGRKPEVLAGYIAGKIKKMRGARASWPAETKPTTGEGIVISGCGRLFRPLYSNLLNLRLRGCGLPVDVWHLPGEFTRKQAAALAPLATLVEARNTPFNALSGQHEVHGLKAWMLAGSRFERTLMLDVNSYALKNPAVIFESGRDCILWQDDPEGHFLDGVMQLRRVLRTRMHAHEFESGQLYVDKRSARVRKALRFAAALNTLGTRLYAFSYGDKETYALAFDLLGEKFSIAPAPEVLMTEPAREERGGLLHPWLDGAPLFYHPMADKEVWWRFREEWATLEQEAAAAEAQCS